jgi:hypothetical protein
MTMQQAMRRHRASSHCFRTPEADRLSLALHGEIYIYIQLFLYTGFLTAATAYNNSSIKHSQHAGVIKRCKAFRCARTKKEGSLLRKVCIALLALAQCQQLALSLSVHCSNPGHSPTLLKPFFKISRALSNYIIRIHLCISH